MSCTFKNETVFNNLRIGRIRQLISPACRRKYVPFLKNWQQLKASLIRVIWSIDQCLMNHWIIQTQLKDTFLSCQQ